MGISAEPLKSVANFFFHLLGVMDDSHCWSAVMLVLTRKVGEILMIGDDVTITVIAFKGNQVRLGIKAPKSVSIHRGELTPIQRTEVNALFSDSDSE